MLNRIIIIVTLSILFLAWFGFLGLIRCPYKMMTGSPCLFCGTSTSLMLILHGDIKAAWDVNPTGILTFVILTGIVFLGVVKIIKGKNR